jgi:hypothetical protein
MIRACSILIYFAVAAAPATAGTGVSVGLAMLAFAVGLTCTAKQGSLDRVGNLWRFRVLFGSMTLAMRALAGELAQLQFA